MHALSSRAAERSLCKVCGGRGICEHARAAAQPVQGVRRQRHLRARLAWQRSFCKECGGGSFCEHGRQRSKYKECGGGMQHL